MPTPPSAFLSLHDVMPETFPQMEVILRTLKEAGIPSLTLLVVPGRAWTDAHLLRLRALAAEGHELAAHGWCHNSGPPRRLYHRVHARLLSRQVAEHLALDEESIMALMQRSWAWFPQHDLPEPSLYVPPAWALGPLPWNRLKETPFSRIEILRGLLDVSTGRLHPLPLVGFEADSPFRAAALRLFNTSQLGWAGYGGRCLRIGLHPHDYELRLASQLNALLSRPFVWKSSDQALGESG